MTGNINLISADRKRFARTRKAVWLTTVASIMFLMLSAAAGGVIFSLGLVKQRQISLIENQISAFQQELIQAGKTEQRQLIIFDRTEAAQIILANRRGLPERLKRLIEVFPENVSVDGFEISQSESDAQISLNADTYAGFFDAVRILAGGGFRAVKLDGFHRDREGIYRLKIVINL